MDPASWPVKKGKAMAYVTLHTINFEKSFLITYWFTR
jgi:hypothetical protein